MRRNIRTTKNCGQAPTLFLHRLLNGELVEIEKVLQACKTLEISLQEGRLRSSPSPHPARRKLPGRCSGLKHGPLPSRNAVRMGSCSSKARRLGPIIWRRIFSHSTPALRVGIGQPVTTLSSVHISFESALQALTYQAYYPHERLFTQR